MSVELGPGLLTQIYDGIQRPLKLIEEKAKSPFIPRGVDVPGLDHSKKWEFKPVAKVGDQVTGGDILGEVEETTLILHKIMVPPGVSGIVKSIKKGSFTIEDTVAIIEEPETKNQPAHRSLGEGGKPVTMLQRWPIRNPRSVNS